MNREEKKEPKPLAFDELLDLFKHLDTRVSHQELLYVPLSAAFVPATLASWESIKDYPLALIAAAAGSLLIYFYYLLTVRRFAIFQKRVFETIEDDHRSNFNSIIHVSEGKVGVQTTRILGLPLLGAVWAMLLRQAEFRNVPECSELISIIAIVGVPALIAGYLYRDTEKRT